MQKIVNPLRTCQDVGACLNAVKPCTGVCRKQIPQVGKPSQRFAPGVVDGPYYRRLSYQQHLVRVLLLAAGGLAFMWLVTSLVLIAILKEVF